MEKKFVSLRRKVFLTLVVVAILSLGLVSSLIFYRLSNVKATLEDSHDQVRQQTVGTSSETTKKQSLKQLTASTKAGANLADDVFSDFKRSVEIIAGDATRLYDNENRYAAVDVKRPDKKNAGTLTVQLLYSKNANPNSAAIKKEVGLLGNLQDTLLSVHESYEPIVADCIATESGIMIMADLISDTKFDDNGAYLPYEASERPWYKGVKETGETYFTKLSRDAHTSKTGIMCGAPVYHNGKLVAVVEAGMYLDNLEAAVEEAAESQSEGSTICIINEDGELVCSSAESGVFAVDFEHMSDLRDSTDAEFGEFIKNAVAGETKVVELEVDGVDSYLVSAPLETVGWTYVVTIPAETVDADTMALSSTLDEIGQNATRATDEIMTSTTRDVIVIALAVLFSVAVLATWLSHRLVAPIQQLTEEVKSIDGEDLNFTWNRTENDEIRMLAEAFEKMTVRMKSYIEEVKTITAEKERIGAELDVATKIQADMLPRIFPAFPERKDMDIFASMDPAKEVGGDFYDFFMVDKDRIGLVMADVSGKGVPAALFMVIAKTLIKNNMQMDKSVEEALTDSNTQLSENNEELLFVTAWVSVVDLNTGAVEYSDAGHEFALVAHPNGTVEEIRPAKKKMPLAAMEGMTYLRDSFELKVGDKLFLYTDGVPEATNASEEMYGMERLKKVLGEHALDKPEDILKAVRKDVDAFVGDAPQFDDLTMLAFERK